MLSRGYATGPLCEVALSCGRVGIRGVQASTRRACFKEQIALGSTSTSKPPKKVSSRPGSAKILTSNIPQYKTPPEFRSLPASLENELLGKARAVIQSPTVPEAAVIENALQACGHLAQILVGDVQPAPQEIKVDKTPASNILSLEENQDSPKKQSQKEVSSISVAENAAVQLVSNTAYQIVTDPKVFITPRILSMYVNAQSLLGRPRSFPEIFKLYASKPIPKPGTNPIRFSTPYPKKPSAHIPLPIANAALTAAMRFRNLPLCFDVIEKSVCAPAFRISKFLRKAFIPVSAAVLAPFAIHQLAAQLAVYQDTMDTQMATKMYFGGILAYVSFTSILGYVAITTSNDQMDRVTWAQGTPMYERWMREEERMMIDRVAGAWGFQQRSRRGEETGPDWEGLRELTGLRRMILDRTDLMEGME
ncbi:MAG: hypothetical protein LQ350_007482 [Teloschistes chrysophthalmus]|nr:MAG: hypothetical protein LQ350_007482 [Niorma chrysophthalma]